jgi:hypothetical protein
MRRTLLAGALLMLLASLPAAAEYRVILKNGSWLRAHKKPVVENGKAKIRLLDGQYAALPEAQIDWKASEAWNRAREARATAPVGKLPEPVKPVPSSIQMVGEPRPAPAARPEPSVRELSVPEPPDPSQMAARNRQRIRQLDAEIEGLRQQKADLDRRAKNAIRLEEGDELRRQAQDVQTKIQAKRAEQNRLILLLPGRKP